MQQNSSLNSFVNALKSEVDVELNQHKVSNSYLLFEILATSELQFKCSICGNYPWAIVADVNRELFKSLDIRPRGEQFNTLNRIENKIIYR